MSGPLRVPVTSLQAGDFLLDPESSRYVAKVHRLTSGDPVLLFDPYSGTQAHGVLITDRLPRVTARIGTIEVAPTHDMPVTLAVAVGKADKPEQAVRDATALGARDVSLIVAERSVARSDSEVRAERLKRLAEQVARQCGRGRLPPIHAPTTLRAFIAGRPVGELKLVCAFHTSAKPLLSFAPAVAASAPGVSILVGPEGGFSQDELQLCLSSGYQVVDLGPYVLRAEVAVSAVLAVLRAIYSNA